MTAALATFIAAFAVLAVLLANVLLFTRFAWWIKLASVAMVACLVLATWRAMPDLLGWPTHTGMPPRFNLNAIHIVEPDKSGVDKGAIYLWITRFATDTRGVVPRAFVLPFSPELQLKVAAAGTRLRKNLPQLGEVVTAHAADAHGRHALDLEFFDLPDPLFPER
ncbi:MAG TPA: hypothetical protein PJ986_20550 [Gammaproteobacteria bacterium]|nr:hypothetical protein [Gammaproteobacteria bacterium]